MHWRDSKLAVTVQKASLLAVMTYVCKYSAFLLYDKQVCTVCASSCRALASISRGMAKPRYCTCIYNLRVHIQVYTPVINPVLYRKGTHLCHKRG